MHFLARAKASWDQECVHRRGIAETVVGQDRETSLSLDWSRGVSNQKGIQFWIETARYREDAVWGSEINDFSIFEDIDTQSKSSDTSG